MKTNKYITQELVTLFVKTWNKRVQGAQLTEKWINHGWCYQFAVLMRLIYGEQAKLCHNYDHAWVKIGNKYYDTSVPDGVHDPATLYHKKGLQDLCEDLDEGVFVTLWRTGGTGHVRYDIIEEVAKAYKKFDTRTWYERYFGRV